MHMHDAFLVSVFIRTMHDVDTFYLMILARLETLISREVTEIGIVTTTKFINY